MPTRMTTLRRGIERVNFDQGEVLPIPLEGRGRIGSGLIGALLLEGGIGRPTFKEIAEGSLQVTKGLLERNRRDFIKPEVIVLLLEGCQTLCRRFIGETFPTLGVGIGAFSQCP